MVHSMEDITQMRLLQQIEALLFHVCSSSVKQWRGNILKPVQVDTTVTLLIVYLFYRETMHNFYCVIN